MPKFQTLAGAAAILMAIGLGAVAVQADPAGRQSEVVRERYPNRAIKLERHIAQDDSQNFINHGSWTMWDPAGNMIAQGTYQNDLRQGDWKRWHYAPEAEAKGVETTAAVEGADALNASEFAGFKRPFLSHAHFVNDVLSGPWTLTDADGHAMFAVEVDKGTLSGKAIWWHSNGKKRREIDFHSGAVEGEWKEWDAEGKSLRGDRYLEGCRLAEATTHYESGAKAAQGVYLHAKDVMKVELDFWLGLVDVSVSGTEGKSLKQGRWEFWYENGETKCEGEFLDDKPVGTHLWWYANGQKQCEGLYADGLPEGRWTYWHENGLRSAQGDYQGGKKSGPWMNWDAEGKVTATTVMKPSSTESAGVPHGSTPATMHPTLRATAPKATHSNRSTTHTAVKSTPAGTSAACEVCKPGMKTQTVAKPMPAQPATKEAQPQPPQLAPTAQPPARRVPTTVHRSR